MSTASPAPAPTATTDRHIVFTLGCPDTTGIVAKLSAFIANHGGWITEAGYFTDPDSGWFFTRQAVRAESLDASVEELREQFAELAAELGEGTRWRIWDTARRKSAVLLVSKEGHCLHDLLGRVAQNDYPMDIKAVIGNHEDLREVAENHGVPFFHVPFPKDAVGKRKAFDEVAQLVNSYEPDAIVLARFMQILPPDLCEMWSGRAINIHHSFQIGRAHV